MFLFFILIIPLIQSEKKGSYLRYAIISDVHGNLEAFKAGLDDIGQQQVDKLLFLGDIVGYGPDPEACIELLQEKVDVCLAGNHDWAVVGLTEVTYFNPVAAAAVQWTKRAIKPEHKDYLRQLKAIAVIDDMCLAHATPYEPEAWHYIFTLGEAKLNFNYFDTRLCFVGHSHTPAIVGQDKAGNCYVQHDRMLSLEPEHRYIINEGSVGQPRDGNPAGCYAIYDTTKQRVELIRFTYDVAQVQQKIIAAGLPAFLAQRLALGQ